MNGDYPPHLPPAAFRGSRAYVHSTDLYEEIVAATAATGLDFAGPIEFKMKARITRRPAFHVAADALAGASATCAFTSGGVAHVVSVVEMDEPVTERKPYDEGPAAAFSRIDGRAAVLSGSTGLRPIEALTALGVHLHKSVLPPPPERRWMLGQLSLRRPLAAADANGISLTIDRLVGSAMTRTKIVAGDGPLGAMIFILG